jgi:hypothetical protein
MALVLPARKELRLRPMISSRSGQAFGLAAERPVLAERLGVVGVDAFPAESIAEVVCERLLNEAVLAVDVGQGHARIGGWRELRLSVIRIGADRLLDQFAFSNDDDGRAGLPRNRARAPCRAQQGLGCGLHIGVRKLRCERFGHEMLPSSRRIGVTLLLSNHCQ